MQNNPIMQYKEQAINTMTQGEQLVVLFDEALKNLHYGSMMMKDKNYATAQKCTEKCKHIFSYLQSILDHKYSISKNLYELYYFINDQIIKAEVKQDPAYLDEVVPIVKDMRETWVEAARLANMKK